MSKSQQEQEDELMELCFNSDNPKNTNKIIRIITNPGFDITNLNMVDDETGYSPLILVCKNRNIRATNAILTIISLRMEYGLIDEVAKDDTTALIWACRNRMEAISITIFELLYKKYPNLTDSNITVQDTETGNNALMWACINKMPNIALELVNTNLFDAYDTNRDNKRLIDLARDMTDGPNDIIGYFIDQGIEIRQRAISSKKPKLKRQNSHENKKNFPENGIIFYINGHSNITGQEVDPTTSPMNEMIKSYMMFLKSFGETTIMDENFNGLIDEKIKEYLEDFLTNQNYSTLYGYLSRYFAPSEEICELQQPEVMCDNMASLLRYLPLYYDYMSTYVYLPRIRENPGKLIQFNRTFKFNSDFNVFSIYFTRHQVSDPTIPNEIIDYIMTLVSLNLCRKPNNRTAILYLCIYFIYFWQHKYKLPINTDLESKLNTFISRNIVFEPDYQIPQAQLNTFIGMFFDKLIIDGTINGKRVIEKDKGAIRLTFSIIFKLPTIVEVESSVIYNSKTDLQLLIDINNIFKCVGIGEPVIISKSCNAYKSNIAENALKPLQEYMDEFEYHPGELKAIEYTKTRKVSSVDNFDKSRSFSRKKRAEFERDYPKRKSTSANRQATVKRASKNNIRRSAQRSARARKSARRKSALKKIAQENPVKISSSI